MKDQSIERKNTQIGQWKGKEYGLINGKVKKLYQSMEREKRQTNQWKGKKGICQWKEKWMDQFVG